MLTIQTKLNVLSLVLYLSTCQGAGRNSKLPSFAFTNLGFRPNPGSKCLKILGVKTQFSPNIIKNAGNEDGTLFRIDGWKSISSISLKARSFSEIVRNEAGSMQVWLEEVYDKVDYEAALVRAGINFDENMDETDEGSALIDSEHNDDGNEEEICDGKEGETTYGEMDLAFFIALLRRINPSSGSRFVDLGSGRGQLVLAAAKMLPWEMCSGIEIMREVYEIGQGALDVAREMQTKMSRCEFFNRDIYNFTEPLKDADVIFAYATCFPTSDGYTLSKLSRVLADNVRNGSKIITVNKR